MKKRGLLLVLAILFAWNACAFCESADEMPAYEQIEMSMTLEDVSLLLGEGRAEGDYLVFAESVICAFYESGRLQAKAMAYESLSEISPETSASTESLKSLKQGKTMEEVTAVLGAEGAEIMSINLSDEEDAGVRRVLAWHYAAGGGVQALFEEDEGEWKLFAIVGIPA